MTEIFSLTERLKRQRLEHRRIAESALFSHAIKLKRQGIRYDDLAQVALELARMLHNLRRYPNERDEADDAFAEHVRRFLHRIPSKEIKRPAPTERPEKGALMIKKADGTRQIVRYYRLGVHYTRITYEDDMPVKCERFDNKTCEMVRDWTMVMRIENSLEVDCIDGSQFVLHRCRQREKMKAEAVH